MSDLENTPVTPTSRNSGQGFGESTVQVLDKESSTMTLEAATAKSYSSIQLQDIDWEKGEVPPLPYGLYLKDEAGNYERLTTYTFKVELRNNYAWEYDLLEKPEQIAGNNIEKHMKKITVFLSKTLETIGGIPLAEVGKRYGNSIPEMLGNMYLADVITMLFGARTFIQRTLDYSVLDQCPCEKKAQVADKDENNLHSLGDVVFRYPAEISDNQPPVYQVVLPQPIVTLAETVTLVNLSPLKFYQLPQINKFRELNTTINVQQMRLMVHSLPDSLMTSQKKGLVFTEDYWRGLSTRSKAALQAAAASILQGGGPVAKIKVTCTECNEAPEFEHPIQWVATNRFICTSITAVPAED